MSPVLVIATINLAAAVLTEATLSFLGVGMPPTYPSLGTLIRIGNEFVFSGIWWIALFPALTLVLLVLAVNIVGDWLRDRFNPKVAGETMSRVTGLPFSKSTTCGSNIRSPTARFHGRRECLADHSAGRDPRARRRIRRRKDHHRQRRHGAARKAWTHRLRLDPYRRQAARLRRADRPTAWCSAGTSALSSRTR